MSEYTTVSARIATPTKQAAEEILSSLGITHSVAISSLYAQIVLNKGLPFEIKLPEKDSEHLLTFWQIRDAVTSICQKYGVEKAWLFGSYARGEATPQSDVDLRIDKGAIRGLELGGFAYDMEQALGTSVDVATTGSLSEEFLASIRKDEVLLYERQDA